MSMNVLNFLLAISWYFKLHSFIFQRTQGKSFCRTRRTNLIVGHTVHWGSPVLSHLVLFSLGFRREMSCSFRPFAHAVFSYIPWLALTRLRLPSAMVAFRSAGCILTYTACPPGPCSDLTFSSRQDFCSRLSVSWVPSKEVVACEKEGQGFNTKHVSGNAPLWGWLEHLPLPKRKLVKIFFLFLTF